VIDVDARPLAMNWGDPRLPDSFWKRCIPEPNTGCWLMLGREVLGGYTQYKHEGRFWLSHRLAFVAAGGELPDFDPTRRKRDAELDHRCHVPCCVAPHHLELVPQKINIVRGLGVSGLAARNERCAKGHPYSEANVKTTARGDGRIQNRCLTCWLETLAARRLARAIRRATQVDNRRTSRSG
jgi:hypothetical protein